MISIFYISDFLTSFNDVNAYYESISYYYTYYTIYFIGVYGLLATFVIILTICFLFILFENYLINIIHLFFVKIIGVIIVMHFTFNILMFYNEKKLFEEVNLEKNYKWKNKWFDMQRETYFSFAVFLILTSILLVGFCNYHPHVY